VKALMPDQPESKVRGRAALLGFPGSKSDTRVSSLSGGEKARLLMGLAAFKGPHLLILDEPTNHLDIDSRTALMEAINEYPGAVILVSHDRFLIDSCVETLWIVADGTVKVFDGDLDEYREQILSSKNGGSRARVKAAKADQPYEKPSKNRDKKPVRPKLDDHEARMDKLSIVIAKIDKALADGKAFRENPAKAKELTKMRGEAAQALSRLEEEWLALSA
jgi:ATP-binding cassette, subfamily F, member 3